MKRILLATLLAASGSVTAAPFYMDVGIDVGGVGVVDDKECATCTSLKDQFTFTYESSSVITDDVGPAGISTGDSIKTQAGYDGSTNTFAAGTLGTNQFTGFLPAETFGANSDNGYGGSNWIITFGIKDWAGTVTVDGSGAVLPNYGPGLLEFYLTTDGTTFNNFMDVKLSTGFVTGTGSVILGEVDFTSVDAGFNNLFNVADPGQCGGLNGFYDIWFTCGPTGLDSLSIDFTGAFDSDVTVAQFTQLTADTFGITTDHDGSGRFDVPEPGTLSLLGLSLLGLGGFRMRKAAEKKIAA
ncbi:PEP-CTERM sorting domain-containing protein [Neptunomonas sp.]|uniref:PEP-CTERM sorting domain-containing protein n=1 Tax=Neptunomonas sp. TaxID=1971898 RepID=UPI0035624209